VVALVAAAVGLDHLPLAGQSARAAGDGAPGAVSGPARPIPRQDAAQGPRGHDQSFALGEELGQVGPVDPRAGGRRQLDQTVPQLVDRQTGAVVGGASGLRFGALRRNSTSTPLTGPSGTGSAGRSARDRVGAVALAMETTTSGLIATIAADPAAIPRDSRAGVRAEDRSLRRAADRPWIKSSRGYAHGELARGCCRRCAGAILDDPRYVHDGSGH
jgi:hypothetical protein